MTPSGFIPTPGGHSLCPVKNRGSFILKVQTKNTRGRLDLCSKQNFPPIFHWAIYTLNRAWKKGEGWGWKCRRGELETTTAGGEPFQILTPDLRGIEATADTSTRSSTGTESCNCHCRLRFDLYYKKREYSLG